MNLLKTSIALLLLCMGGSYIMAQDTPKPTQSAQELAEKLANPVSSMISVPLQNNMLYGIGPYNGSKYTVNIQPVVPVSLGGKWNLITRYIVPIVDQGDITAENTNQTGLSDITLSGYLTPKKSGKIMWAVGPIFLLPTATDKFLGTEKFSMGPTALLVKQGKGLTLGLMANQMWSVAGSSSRPDVNQLFLQGFFSHSFPSGASLGANIEMTQNWAGKTTTLNFNGPSVGAVTALGKQKVQLSIMPIIPLAGPKDMRPDWGLRAVVSFIFL